MKKIILVILLVSVNICLSTIKATTLPQSVGDSTKYTTLKPFTKTIKKSLIIGAVLMPIGLAIAESGSKQASIGAPFAEIGGGVLGLLGLLLIAFGLLFWFGRWLVRRHYRLLPRKRRWQWLVYLGGLIALIFLGFILVLGF